MLSKWAYLRLDVLLASNSLFIVPSDSLWSSAYFANKVEVIKIMKKLTDFKIIFKTDLLTLAHLNSNSASSASGGYKSAAKICNEKFCAKFWPIQVFESLCGYNVHVRILDYSIYPQRVNSGQ